MHYLFNGWEKIEKRLVKKFLFIFLDYDGTLSRIARTPDRAVISQKIKRLLRNLSKKSDCRLAIITGRSLKDIQCRVGLKNIIYVGNHGMEMKGPGVKFKSGFAQGLRPFIRRIYREIDRALSGIKGVIIEDKGLTLSVHYRLVKNADITSIKRIVDKITQPYRIKNRIKINSGKRVIEIKPPGPWDKGRAVLWLLKRPSFKSGNKKILPVYIGDDMTDEDAFRALRRKGLTIFVGTPTVSNANYYLRNTKEVSRFIKQVSDLKAG